MSNRNGHSAVETVELDRQAVQRLEEARVEGENLSAVILRCIRPRQTATEVLRTMRRAAVSQGTLKAIDESASRRRKQAYRSKG